MSPPFFAIKTNALAKQDNCCNLYQLSRRAPTFSKQNIISPLLYARLKREGEGEKLSIESNMHTRVEDSKKEKGKRKPTNGRILIKPYLFSLILYKLIWPRSNACTHVYTVLTYVCVCLNTHADRRLLYNTHAYI